MAIVAVPKSEKKLTLHPQLVQTDYSPCEGHTNSPYRKVIPQLRVPAIADPTVISSELVTHCPYQVLYPEFYYCLISVHCL